MNDHKSLSRREFTKISLAAAAAVSSGKAFGASEKTHVRLGGPVSAKSPEDWIKELKKRGYKAAYCPIGANSDEKTVKDYENAAKNNDITISEVGAWSNPLDPDSNKAKGAIAYCKAQLDLADRIGARCCVNISGSRSEPWDGHDKKNLTRETFDMIVAVTRDIIDDVKPKRAFFTLEPMPWMYPDSVDSYLRLIEAMDRKQFAAHFDPVNIVSSPQLYYNSGQMIKDAFKRLGTNIKSCHAKDILMDQKLTTHLSEVRPGLGHLDYVTYLKELSKRPDVPLMLEHLKTDNEYNLAARHIRTVGSNIGIEL